MRACEGLCLLTRALLGAGALPSSAAVCRGAARGALSSLLSGHSIPLRHLHPCACGQPRGLKFLSLSLKARRPSLVSQGDGVCSNSHLCICKEADRASHSERPGCVLGEEERENILGKGKETSPGSLKGLEQEISASKCGRGRGILCCRR